VLAGDQHGPKKEFSARNSSGEVRGKHSRTLPMDAQANARSYDSGIRFASESVFCLRMTQLELLTAPLRLTELGRCAMSMSSAHS
jgi:hypothetical protein